MVNDENTIIINGIEYIRKDAVQLRYPEATDGMKFGIIRASEAGVHAGWIKTIDTSTRTVELVGSRRMFRWFARSLSGASLEGVDPSKCKFGDPIGIVDDPHIVAGFCEVIPCTEEAQKAIEAVEPWKNE